MKTLPGTGDNVEASAAGVVAKRRMRWALLTGTALVAVSLAVTMAPQMAMAQQGGKGGDADGGLFVGGAGGTSGFSGGDGLAGVAGSGGGGGGAGAFGGLGGGFGAFGIAAGGNGGDGGVVADVVSGVSLSITTANGGGLRNGADGGNGESSDVKEASGAGGGGGGAGANGLNIGAPTISITGSGSVTGGDGGAGGIGGFGSFFAGAGGGGGDGGAGIVVITKGSTTITNAGSILGGNGGIGGEGGFNSEEFSAPSGSGGVGGAGLVGSNLTVINTGKISGGLGNISGGKFGSVRANSITFNSGKNNLDISTGSLTGDIAINAGTLTFNQAKDATLKNNVVGGGDVTFGGKGALTVTGGLNYEGSTGVTGSIKAGAENVFNSASKTTIQSGGTLDLGGFQQTIDTLGITGGKLVNGAIVSTALTSTGGFITDVTGGSGITFESGKTEVSGANVFGKLVNTGTVDITSGKLSAATINNNAGTINVGKGATLEGTGNTLNNAAVLNIATGGIVTDAGDVNNLAAGVINFNGPGGVATLSSGTFVVTNQGQINVVSGDVDIVGILTNSGSGLLSLGSGAGLVTAGLVTNKGTAQIDIKGGTLDTLVFTNLSTNAAGLNIGANGELTATAVINKAGATIVNAGFLSSDVPVINGGQITNSGTLDGGIVNTGKIGNTGTIDGGITNTGGTVTTSGTVTGGLINAGTTKASGKISGDITNVLFVGAFTTTGNLVADGKFDNQASAKLNVDGGSFTGITTLTNAGTVTISANRTLSAATITNNKGGTINVGAGSALRGTGNTLNNNATINVAAGGSVTDAGNINNNATGVINFNGASGLALMASGTKVIANAGKINVTAAGAVQINGDVTNSKSGALTLAAGAGKVGVVGNLTNGGAGTVDVKGGQLTVSKTLTNQSSAATGINIAAKAGINATNITNKLGSTIVNAGTLASANKIQNDGSLKNNVGGVINGGVINTSFVKNDGTLNGGFDNAAGATVVTTGVINQGLTNKGSVVASGAVNGPIVNNGAGSFVVTAALTGSGAFTNNDTAQLLLAAGDFTGLTTLTNNSTNASGVVVAGGMKLSAVHVVNAAGSKIINSGTLTSSTPISNSGEIVNPGTINGGVANLAGGVLGTFSVLNGGVTNAGTVNATGAVNGAIVNDNIFNVIGNLTGDSTFKNNAAGQLNVTGGDYSDITTLTNAGTVTIADAKRLNAGAVTNAAGATIDNSGTLNSSSPVSNKGTIDNKVSGTINGGVANLSGGVVTSLGGINNGLTNAGTVDAAGAVNGVIINDNIFNVTGALTSSGTFTNNAAGKLNVTGGDYTQLTTLTNSGTVTIADGKTLEAGVINNKAGKISVGAGATLKGTANTLNNAAVIDVATGGAVIDAGAINNLAAGVINFNGPGGNATLKSDTSVISNAGQINVVSGNVNVTGNVTNTGSGALNVTGGNFTGATSLTNLGGTVDVAAGRTLSTTTAIANNAGVFTSLGTVTSPLVTNFGTMNLEGTLNATTSFTNNGLVDLTGNLAGTLPTISNVGTFNLNNRTLNNGAGTLTNTGLVTAFGAANTISGNVINNNRITLKNGATTDALVIGGKLGGAGTLAVDANMAIPAGAGRGDLVTVNGVTSGTVNVAINPVATGAALTTAIDVFNAAGGGAPTVTVNGASRFNPFLSNGLVNYFLTESAPASGLFQIQSQVNTAPAMGIASGLSGTIGALQSGFHQPVSAIVSRPENCGPNQTVGGMFIRVNGGTTDTTLNGNASAPGLGAANSRTSSSSSFGGFQTGFDMGKCNVGNSGWDLHFGVMTGMVDVKLNAFTSVTNTLGPPGTAGTSADISVPFVGAYAFARNSGITLEANVRHDFYRAEISSTSAGINFVPRGTNVSGAGTSLNMQASYRMPLGERFFVEPQAGYSYGVSSFGVIKMFNGLGGPQVGTIDFNDSKSSLGRIGLLAGTTVQLTDKLFAAPFVQAILWREFADPTIATTTLVPSGQRFAVQTERVGTFGQVGGGVQLRLLESPFSGFVRADMRFGDKIDGLAINAGLRGNFTTQ